MKKHILTLAVVLVLAGTSIAADGVKKPAKIKVTVNEGNKVEVLYKASGPQEVNVEILNKKKNVLFSEKITDNSFMRPYNLSKLKKGTYYVRITDGTSTTEDEIIIENPVKFTIREDAQHARIFRVKDENKFAVIALSGKKDVINVTIRNEKGNILHNSDYEITDSLGHIYNLRKFKSASYTIEVKNGKGEILDTETF